MGGRRCTTHLLDVVRSAGDRRGSARGRVYSPGARFVRVFTMVAEPRNVPGACFLRPRPHRHWVGHEIAAQRVGAEGRVMPGVAGAAVFLLAEGRAGVSAVHPGRREDEIRQGKLVQKRHVWHSLGACPYGGQGGCGDGRAWGWDGFGRGRGWFARREVAGNARQGAALGLSVCRRGEVEAVEG